METNNTKKTGNNKRKRLFIYLVLLLGVIWLTGNIVSAGGNLVLQAKKITYILRLIQQVYVEEPELDKLCEGAIEGMLKRLDPHSTYIPTKEQERISERDIGEFEGIGISFVIQNELITVMSPINGTPAERLGVRAGDRIIEIDDISAFGITNEEVFKKLRGPKGTSVKIKVARDGVPEPIEFTIIRDKIPIRSVLSSFMLNDKTGYIMLNQFMATSTKELNDAITVLESEGMNQLIFDLRNNGGGRLSQAVAVADLFIPEGHTLVSRKGRTGREDSVYTSTSSSTRNMFDLIILINTGSASASEIVSGAVQDLDRGLIAGTTSFGKGLVQYPYRLNDGAVIRLSTAHWFTPSGRLVQRPYDKGRGEYYAVRYGSRDDSTDVEELNEDYEKFYTLEGREIHPYDGIIPDIEIKPLLNTVGTARLINARILFNLAEKLVKEKNLTMGDFNDFLNNFQVTDEDLSPLIEMAEEKELIYNEELLQKDILLLKREVKADIAQLLWNDQSNYYQVRISNDNVIQEALKLFEKAGEISQRWQ